jgi:hypothetical protein
MDLNGPSDGRFRQFPNLFQTTDAYALKREQTEETEFSDFFAVISVSSC